MVELEGLLTTLTHEAHVRGGLGQPARDHHGGLSTHPSRHLVQSQAHTENLLSITLSVYKMLKRQSAIRVLNLIQRENKMLIFIEHVVI